MALQPSIVIRLVLAKYLFLRGSMEQSRGDEVAMAVAVLHYHDCLELFLKAVADAVGVRTTKDLPFAEYPAKIAETVQRPMILLAVVRRVNLLRVPLKHQGLLPGATALRALSGEVEEFLERNCQEFLDRDFHDVSLADLIGAEEVRRDVKTAETAIESGRFKEAFERLAVAFHALTEKPASSLPGAPHLVGIEKVLVHRGDIPSLKDSKGRRLDRMVEQLNQRYARLVGAVEVLQRGLNFGDYQRFRLLTPTVQSRSQDGEWLATWVTRTALHDTRENATFCLNFVIEAALKAPSRPELRDPRSQFTVEVEADSVPVLRYGPLDTLVEERRALKAERFEGARLAVVMAPSGGEHWMIGEWHETQRWEGVYFLPLAGVRIVKEHRIKMR